MNTPSLGQHFLISSSIARTIVSAARVSEKDIVLEVGPGKGILTEALLTHAKRVLAVEKDPSLFAFLQKRFKTEIQEKKLQLLHADILHFPPEAHGLKNSEYKMVANIPYYITGNLLRHFLSPNIQPQSMTLLIQKEVAERIARDKKESVLSISVKAYGEPKYVKTIKAGSFTPAPKVDSAILVIEDISKEFFKNISEEMFFRVLKAGFAHKRKLLRRNLEATAEKELINKSLEGCGISLSTRAEDISLLAWQCLTKELS